MNNINEIVNIIVNKIKDRVNEGISSRLFHFCPLVNMYSIAKTDSFKLTSVEEKGPRNKLITSLPTGNGENKQYNYYMCFSRTPSSLVGYVGMRRNYSGGKNWKQSVVRIEVDGEKLMANYKGMPVNYYGTKNDPRIDHFYEYDKNRKPINTVQGRYGNVYSKRTMVNTLDSNGKIKQKYINRITPHADDKLDPRGKKRSGVSIDYGVIDRNQAREYEDRIFSNNEYITNIKERGYIKRIDIYVSKNILNGRNDISKDAFFMIDEIIKEFGNIVHIYDNFSSFESMNITNSFNDINKLNQKYSEVSRNDYNLTHTSINKNELQLNEKELKTIIKYAVILAFFGNGYKNWKELTCQNTISILNDINIKSNDFIVQYINKLIDVIERAGTGFFTIQSSHLTKELEEIPPYKKELYIPYLEKIRKIEEDAYAQRVGKRVSILTSKVNFCV